VLAGSSLVARAVLEQLALLWNSSRVNVARSRTSGTFWNILEHSRMECPEFLEHSVVVGRLRPSAVVRMCASKTVSKTVSKAVSKTQGGMAVRLRGGVKITILLPCMYGVTPGMERLQTSYARGSQ
jgi:hypothetical protein